MAPKINSAMDVAVVGASGAAAGAGAGSAGGGGGGAFGKSSGFGNQKFGAGGSNAARASGAYVARDAARPQKHSHRPHRKPEQNLNHLLNFSYARPSPPSGAGSLPARRAKKSTPSYGVGSGYHPLDKAHFVNANYRFVVRASAPDGYKSNLIEADLPIEWESILQVIASAQTQRDNCPICLDGIPVAPRMAKCGHTFCYPCILRYLASEDLQTGRTNGKWRKCPICHDGIYAHELRPVRWFESIEPVPRQGEEILLRLIARRSGSMYALPREVDEVELDTVPWHNHPDAIEYARFMSGDAEYVIGASRDEIAALRTAQEHDGKLYGEQDPWMTIAVEKIEETIPESSELGSAPAYKPRKAAPHVNRAPIDYTQPLDGAPDAFTRPTAAAAQRAERRDGNTRALEMAYDDRYYFYQPRTGCHYYLSPFDIRVLKRAFEHFTSFPDHLIARVEHTHTHSLTEDMRRRTKYLSHLPLGCEVTFLECDWSNVLEEDVLKAFAAEIEKRRQTRRTKAAQEDAARRRAQLAEERRERNGGRDLQFDFDEDYLSPGYDAAGDRQVVDDPALHEFSDSSYFGRRETGDSNTYDPLRGGSLGGGAGSRSRTVWGTQAVASSYTSPPLAAMQLDDGEIPWADQIAQWTEQNTLERTIQETTIDVSASAALEQEGNAVTSAARANGNAGSGGGGGGNGGKGKNKKKKLVLMSTGFTPR